MNTSYQDPPQRSRYLLAIIVGLCLAPLMYSKGCYLHSPSAPVAQTQPAADKAQP